jgi:SAM-dependent methyltransferase
VRKRCPVDSCRPCRHFFAPAIYKGWQANVKKELRETTSGQVDDGRAIFPKLVPNSAMAMCALNNAAPANTLAEPLVKAIIGSIAGSCTWIVTRRGPLEIAEDGWECPISTVQVDATWYRATCRGSVWVEARDVSRTSTVCFPQAPRKRAAQCVLNRKSQMSSHSERQGADPQRLAAPPGAVSPEKQNWMHPIRWVPSSGLLLDVGCNTGELLSYCRSVYPDLGLAGVEVNAEAIKVARRILPEAELKLASARDLPFASERFDCVTCIEVLEHVPMTDRASTLVEIRRVLRPGGRLVLRVPHDGTFSWLDANNLRFRFPRLYRTLLGRGRRDNGYEGCSHGVVWHHHFTREELLTIAGDGWEEEACRYGAFLLFPMVGLASWPFYHSGRTAGPVFRALQRLANYDIGRSYGERSYDILLVLRRVDRGHR